ncbi:MAG: carboxypeptidase regulatory-like domain-containing protein [Candidatus Poribacteria bacterium]
MRHYFLTILLILNLLTIIVGCGSDSEEKSVVIEQGDIFGTVIDKETGLPIKDASVQIDGKTSQTDDKGKYTIRSVPTSDSLKIVVTATDYAEYNNSLSLKQELLSYDIALIPNKSPFVPVIAILDSLSKDIGSLDEKKIPDIQSHFSKDYVAGNDDATIFGIFAGVIPPNYDEIPKTMKNICNKYTKLEFKFENPDVKIEGDNALVLMRIAIKAQTKAPDPKDWDIVADGKIIFKKQDNDWKMIFWGLIQFVKFEEKPL